MANDQQLSVAIIGGGPGGLAAAIALSELPYLSVKVYEASPEPREVGAGISISANAWNVLQLLGAADNLHGASKAHTYQRNGYTGEIAHLEPYTPSAQGATKYGPIRARRTRLQAALLKEVPVNTIEFDKKLVSLEDLGEGKGVRLTFQDGTEKVKDLVVGADGIRSVTRKTLFPDHTLNFTGNTAWRVLIPFSSVKHLDDFPVSTAWWHGLDGHFYFSHVDPADDQELCELTVRSYQEPEIPGRTVTWAIPATNERVQSRCEQYSLKIKEILALVPEGSWREFAMHAGPCLQSITGWDKVALIGDASHPLSGAFGSGAAFAMEDGWILARAIEHTIRTAQPIKNALEIFAEIRSPYYQRMYDYLDERSRILRETRAANKNFEDLLRARVAVFGAVSGGVLDWIYKNNIKQVWQEYLRDKTAQTKEPTKVEIEA